MENIQSTHATFEQSKLLKEKGFNISCKEGWYVAQLDPYKGQLFPDDTGGKHEIEKPEQWQIVEWLRVEKGIWVCVNINGLDKLFTFDIHNYKQKGCSLESILDGGFITPQEAYSAAFDYILKELI
jgi:hypothetical protein